MTFNDLKERYLSYVKRETSIGNYNHNKSHLDHFSRYLDRAKISLVKDIDYKLIDDYIAHRKLTCSNRTLNISIGAIKRTYRYSKIDFSYLYEISKFKEQKKTFRLLELPELTRVRRYIRSLNPDIGNNLYYIAMVMLLMDTGARANELLHIERKNIDFMRREILLTTTKTKMDRVVFFKESTAPIIKRILSDGIKTNYLLYNYDKKRPGNYFDMDNYFRKLRDVLGYKKLHAHMFRHSLATIWLEQGADLVAVQRVLGHTNLETTQLYIHASNKHVKNTYQLFSID